MAARLVNGTHVVGVAAGESFAFVASEVDVAHRVAVPPSGSQFRSRDAFPALLPRILAGDRFVLAAPVGPSTLGLVPNRVVAYVDGYGNLKTTWHEAPAPSGTRVRVRVGDVEAGAVVSDGTFAVPAGELSFAPGSSGWATRAGGEVRWYELLARGGNAAELFGFPASGTPVEVLARR